MKYKWIIALCLALAVLTGGLLILFTDAHDSPEKINSVQRGGKPFPVVLADLMGVFRPGANIKSDGVRYPINTINATQVATEVSEGERLPTVNDRETLLKLLLDRGLLYESSGVLRSWQNGVTTALDESLESFAMDIPVPSGGDEPYSEAKAKAIPEGEPSVSATTVFDSGDDSYSKTNEQVAGVSEGDIVKTDGQYIYALSSYGNILRIIKAEGAASRVVSTITLDDIWGAEFYLIGKDRLAIVGSEYVSHDEPLYRTDSEKARIEPYYYGWYQDECTVLAIYDISDRGKPEQLRSVAMDGWRVSSRVIGNIVYLVTNKGIQYISYDQADSSAILPYCRDTATGEGFQPIDFENIYYVPDSYDSSYLLVGAIDVFGDEEFEPEAYLGAGSNLYMSQNAMYITKGRWDQTYLEDDVFGSLLSGWEKTDILRFAIDGTAVNYAGMGTVAGSPINQYSMDEYKGYFRIATTEWQTGTFVTVLDASTMKTVGRTEPLAPREQMRSMRFVGETGYVVTFENVDPLFTIDLSDPYKPKVMGELKIPGFSQYLHPLGNGLMLGIGRDTQETFTRDSNGKETVIGFRDVGMKVSLFDVSDPFDPKEIDVLLLGEGWAEVSYNPRALMCDAVRGLYGFTVERYDNRGAYWCDALILKVANGKLSIATSLKIGEAYSTYEGRLCFIADTLYIIHSSGVVIYDYNSFEKQGSVSFS